MSLSASDLHLAILKNRILPLAYNPEKAIDRQRSAIREKFQELVNPPEKATDPKPMIDFISKDDIRFDEIHFRFESKPGFYVTTVSQRLTV